MAEFDEKLFASPWTNIGLGILANNYGNYGAFGPAVGKGALTGIQNYQQQQQLLLERQLREQAIAEKKRKEAERDKARQDLQTLLGQTATNPAGTAAPMTQRQFYSQLGQIPGYEGEAVKGVAGLLAPQTQAGFTLSPGQTRYDAAGQPIANIPGGPAKEKTFEHSEKLRKEFLKVTGDFAKQNDSYGRILASAKDPSAAGDLALIFNYMKVLDPGSVVRESEFATASNAAGVPERLRAQYNRILSGERLSHVQRADFVNRAQKLYEEAATGYDKRTNEYTRLAEQFEVDPKGVIMNRQLYEVGQPMYETKTVGGKSFIKVGEDWYEQ